MKRKNLLLLPLFMLLLAGCKKSSEVPPISSEEPPVVESSVSSSQTESTSAISIQEARGKANKTKVEVEGTITGIYGMANSKFGVIIQQGDYAITLTFVEPDVADTIAVGDKINAQGEVEEFNGLIQLQNSVIKKLDVAGDTIVPHVLTSWDATALAGMDGRLVKAENLKYKSGTVDTSKNSDIKVAFASALTVEFSLYMSNYIAMAEKTAIKTKIDGLLGSDTITFIGPIGWYTNPQLNPITASTITVVAGEAGGPVAPTSVAFDKDAVSLRVGETVEAVAAVKPLDATHDGVVYSTKDAAVATVSAAGVVTAVGEGKTQIVATVGTLIDELDVTVNRSLAGVEAKYTLDMSKASAMVETSQTGSNYSYGTEYTIKMTDGTNALNWKAQGINPNNWAVAGIRFGGKSGNVKLGTAIASGLPMAGELAGQLAATYVQSIDAVPGEVNDIAVMVHDIWSSGVTPDKMYIQASADANFTSPINLGAKSYGIGEVVFRFDTALVDHYYRIIVGMVITNADSNVAVILNSVTFNKNTNAFVPEDDTVTALSFTDSSLSLVEGATKATSLVVTPVDGDLTGLVYASSDANVATVSALGVITAVGAGSANITATIGEVVATLPVTVTALAALENVVVPAVNNVGTVENNTAITISEARVMGNLDSYLWLGDKTGTYMVNYYQHAQIASYQALAIGDAITVKGVVGNGSGLATGAKVVNSPTDLELVDAPTFIVTGNAVKNADAPYDLAGTSLDNQFNFFADFTPENRGVLYTFKNVKFLAKNGDWTYFYYNDSTYGGSAPMRMGLYKVAFPEGTDITKLYDVTGVIVGSRAANDLFRVSFVVTVTESVA